MLIEEIKNIKSDKKELRKFGITVGSVILIISLLLFYWEKSFWLWMFIAADLLIFAGLLLPGILLPLQKAWMTLAVLLGFVMTRVILSILYYIIITPIGFITKIIGKDFLSLKIDKKAKTCWNYRTKKDYQNIDTERQF
ncbi:MAG: hypothetical protein J5I57_00010 [Melioribacteraceae bacterium]|nr:hypothetical protein [Melioribacteraceae bacterium]